MNRINLTDIIVPVAADTPATTPMMGVKLGDVTFIDLVLATQVQPTTLGRTRQPPAEDQAGGIVEFI